MGNRIINTHSKSNSDKMHRHTFRLLVVCLSSRAFEGIYKDKSGPALTKKLTNFFEDQGLDYHIDFHLIPDDAETLEKLLLETVAQSVDFVFTTGGTGIGTKDITVECVRKHLHKEIPGIMEHIRIKSAEKNMKALLSRSVAGCIENSLVFTLPGSTNAIHEYCDEIFKILMHLWFMVHDIDVH